MHSPARKKAWLTLDSEGRAMPATTSTKNSSVILKDYSVAREALFSRAAEAAAAVACHGTRSPVPPDTGSAPSFEGLALSQ